MSFVTKDGFWIECEDGKEFVVPPRGLRSKLNVIDDYAGINEEELQKAINALERDLTIQN